MALVLCVLRLEKGCMRCEDAKMTSLSEKRPMGKGRMLRIMGSRSMHVRFPRKNLEWFCSSQKFAA